MVRSISLASMLLAIGAVAGADDHKDVPKTAKHAGLEKLKKLAGTWVELDKDGKATDTVVSVFKVTSAGSAVHETLFPGKAHEMVTVYHLDGKDLVLTHYCAFQNQPRMKADPKSPANKLEFKFIGGANIDPAKDAHMHEGTITFIDPNTILVTWQGWSDGKVDEAHKFSKKLGRKK
jgi:hypothetical protein